MAGPEIVAELSGRLPDREKAVGRSVLNILIAEKRLAREPTGLPLDLPAARTWR